MDARTALELLEELCRELDLRRAILQGAFFRKYVRPVGFGVMLSFGAAGAFTGCAHDVESPVDSYGIADIQPQDLSIADYPPARDAYGVDSGAIADYPPTGDLYGMVDSAATDMTPWPDSGMADGPAAPDTVPWPDMVEPKDLYGVPDQ